MKPAVPVEPDFLDQVCAKILSHLEIENQALDQIEAVLALPLAARLVNLEEVEDRARRMLHCQRYLSEARQQLQYGLEVAGLVNAHRSLPKVIEMISDMKDSSRLNFEFLKTRRRYSGIRQNLLRLQRIVDESTRICQGYLDALMGQDRNYRYGPNGRLAILQPPHTESTYTVARAG